MKHVRLPRLAPSLALCGTFAVLVALGPAGGLRADAQSAPPPPPPPNNLATPNPTAPPTVLPSGQPIPTATPSPTAAPKGRRKRGSSPNPAASATANPEPSATPTSPAFATLDGTWEVQLQYIDRTEYSYLTLAQDAAGGLTGGWKVAGKTYPLDGTYDGRLIRLTVKEPTGNVTMAGYVEGASDMVGAVDFGVPKIDPTAFTAEHRASQKGSIFKKGT